MALYKGLVPKIMRLGPGKKKSSYTDIKIILINHTLPFAKSFSLNLT